MTSSALRRMALLLMLAPGVIFLAHAEGAEHEGGRGVSLPLLPKYQQECAACHIAYPPGFLPATSWQHLLGSLDKHFGVDASLDVSSTKEIGSWLGSHAGSYKRVSERPAQDRISQSSWFLRQHREGELPAGVWKRASVGSPANCAACHPNAAQGNFSEHQVRIPK